MTNKELIEKAAQSVREYNVVAAKAVATESIKAGVDPVEMIQNGFTKGMTYVGEMFDKKKLFLPHVMAAANAMNAAVDILTPELEKQGKSASGGSIGTFVICSIEGDIHSIGKDIVAIMLKVAGFNVVNLGRDIPLKEIVDACKANKADAVGTSALMTSTMIGQKTLEEMLTKAGLRKNIITNVGGAPITQKWSDDIGADVYSENATDAVVKMKKAMSKK